MGCPPHPPSQPSPRKGEKGDSTLLSPSAATAAVRAPFSPVRGEGGRRPDEGVALAVSVYSTQTVVLGGLISGQESRNKDSVPGVNKIPLIGDLIGSTNNTARRNELIVFITPQIIQSGQDAATVSEELRSKMKLFE